MPNTWLRHDTESWLASRTLDSRKTLRLVDHHGNLASRAGSRPRLLVMMLHLMVMVAHI